jgi:quinoprotein glucose dehydrogenase
VLWTGDLPGQARGIPAMYEVGGRQYLVVNATSPSGGGGGGRGGAGPANPSLGYVVYALPAK